MVNFFASWCIPCQEEAPDLSRFHYEQAHTADGADMVSVVFHDTTSTARAFLQSERRPLARRQRPRRRRSPSATGSPPRPTTFVINPAGRVTAVLVGPATQKNLDSFLQGGPDGTGRTSGG